MKFRSDDERLHHRAALLQAAEQHRRARRPPLDRAPGTQLAEVQFTDETASGWQEEELTDPVRDHRRHDLRRLLPLRAAAASPSAAATSPRPPGTGAADAPPTRAATASTSTAPAAASRPRPGTRPTTGSTRSSSARRAGGHARAARQRPSRRPTAPPASRSRPASPSTFDEAIDPATVTALVVPAARRRRHARRRRRSSYDAATQHRDAHALGPAPATAQTYTATVKSGAGGVKDAAGQPAGRGRLVVLQQSARVPVHRLRARPTARSATRRATAARGRHEVPLDRGRLHHRAALLQAAQQHRHPRRAPVDRRRGQQLAEVQFTNETASGWQQEELPSPVPISAGHDLRHLVPLARTAASPSAPATSPAAPTTAPLHAPALAGGNGVYKYGASGFPDQTFNATNYWVDADVRAHRAGRHAAAAVGSTDARPPAPTASRSTANVKVTFDEPIDRLTVNTGSILLSRRRRHRASRRGHLRRRDAQRDADAAGAARLRQDLHGDGQERHAPASTDLAGNRLAADATWSFTHARRSARARSSRRDAAPGGTQAVHDQPLEVGVKFRADEDGYITALRFYKQSNNTGTHVGHLWSADGQLLATATFTERDRVRLAERRPAEPGRRSRRTRSTSPPTTRAAATSRSTRATSTQRVDRGRCARSPRLGRRQRRLPLRRAALPGPDLQRDQLLGRRRPSSARSRRTRAGRRHRDRRPPPAPSTSPRDATVTATFDEQLDARPRSPADVHAARRAGRQPVPATVSYDAQTRTAKLQPTGAAAYATHLHRDAQGRRGRRHRRRRQPARGRQDLDVHDRRPAARPRARAARSSSSPTRATTSAPTTRRSCARRA